MCNRVFFTLIISASLSFPSFCQQPSTSSTSTSVDQASTSPGTATATGKEPLRKSDENFWGGDEPGVASLILHPFARKEYVRRQLRPISDRLDELNQLAAANSEHTKNIDAGSQHGIQLASDKVSEANQHAGDAETKAQSAQQAASQTNTRLTSTEGIVGNIDHYKTTNQIEIRFRPGQRELSADARRVLDDLATPLKDQRGYVIEMHSFSAGRGQSAISSSRQMSDAAARYLMLKHEIPAYRIYALAMGNASLPDEQSRTGSRRSKGGRVEIKLLKNDIDQIASTSGANTSPR